MKYIVYKTTNIINGKIYIGVHGTNPDIFDGYIGCGMYNQGCQRNRKGFPAAVRKYGYENFKRETLFEYPFTKEGMEQAYAKEAEIVTINFIKRKDTYNLTVGGKFTVWKNLKKEIAQYTIDGKFIRTWSSITEAEQALGLTAINQAIKGVSKYCGNFQWRLYTNNLDIGAVALKEKAVYQFDLQGNLLKTWKSTSLASTQFANPKSARVAINNVCCKKTRQAYGYFWSYKCKFEYEAYAQAVAKYDDNGIFLESYTSIKEAAKINNIPSKSGIRAAISGKQKRCKGFRWRYFYGDKSNIAPLNKDIV